MDLMTENYPESCSSLGLDCGTCIHQVAASVGKICRGVEPEGVHQLFFELFPSPGCRPMAQAFQLAYCESQKTHKPVVQFTSAAA